MSSYLTINVINRSHLTQDFYIFQQPATFSGGGHPNSNSLFAVPLGSYDATGSTLSFMVRNQPYAAIQQAHTPPMVGQTSGFASAARAIDLARPDASSNDGTIASVSPLGLSMPRPTSGVAPGAFRITTPSFQPMATLINVGSAVETQGAVVLSSFVQGQPMTNIDCAPAPVFFVQTGRYTPGTVLNFDMSSMTAARCDFSGGASAYDVSYNMDGTWTINSR